MTMTPVNSSCVNSIGYDEATQDLRVEFKNGEVYSYPNTSKVLYEKLMASPSKGKFLNEYFVTSVFKKIS